MPSAPVALDPLSFENTERAFSYKTDFELYKSQILFSSVQYQFLLKIGPPILQFALNLGLPIRGLTREYFYNQFCGGYTLDEIKPVIEKLANFRVKTILDFAVEAQSSESSYQRTTEEVLSSIEFSRDKPNIPFIAVKMTGLGSGELLEKAAHSPLSGYEKTQYNAMRDRLDAICQAAAKAKQAIFIDAEESWLQIEIDRIAEEMMWKYNRERAVVFTTLQMYRHDRLAYLKEVYEKALDRGVILGVKLVRGAYLEKENLRAQKLKYPTPMQPTKQRTDDDYNNALQFIVSNYETIAVCAGTHNEASNLILARLMNQYGVPLDHPHVYSSQLFGMSDNISFNLADYGVNVAKYLPYGSLDSVLPYLFRRAQENSAISGQTSRELRLVETEIRRRRKAGSR